jgi:hypothetical protein
MQLDETLQKHAFAMFAKRNHKDRLAAFGTCLSDEAWTL